MRRLLVASAVAGLALAAAASAFASPVFVINGRGWGHGIGMSQYGAYGFALQGWTYDRILAHYYRGTQVGSASPRQVRVLLATGRPALTVSAATATDRKGAKYTLAPGRQTIGPRLEVTTTAGRKKLASPVRFAGGVTLGGNAYRGSLVVYSSSGVLSAVNHVGLEEYLYGVVPWEMPSTWAREALKAQAVVARSYALATLKRSATFDLYADTRSQVYGGIRAEDARTNAAVAATAGRVVLHAGAVAHTFFHSTSGGRTATITDVWPAGRPLPYLVSVPDPYDSLSPYHRWKPVALTGAQVAARLGSSAPAGLADLTVARNGSRRAASVTATGAGGTRKISPTTFRFALGLRSTWFRIGVLSLEPRRSRVAFGDRVVLAGIARGLGRASLERRSGGAWKRVGAVTVARDGRFAVTVRPRTTTTYRIAAGAWKGTPRRVLVAARVNFFAYEGGDELAGLVRPRVAGASVEIQRATASGAWRTIAATATDAHGRFRARVALVPGTYRARAVVGRGLVPGTTPVLRVVAR